MVVAQRQVGLHQQPAQPGGWGMPRAELDAVGMEPEQREDGSGQRLPLEAG